MVLRYYMKEKTYNIITIGCQMNKSDSERIASYLDGQGYVGIANSDQADMIVLTTCAVRQSAEDKAYSLAHKIKKANPECILVLTGCLAEREDVKKKLDKFIDAWMPIGEIAKFKLPLSAFRQKKSASGPDNCGYLEIAAKHKSEFSAYVPIGNGCDNFCSYCVVPYARGREKYRPAGSIINEVRKLVDNGFKEINLIAQNVNSYRSGIGERGSVSVVENKSRGERCDFTGLLSAINDIPGKFWIRFATSHPKDMSDELIDMVAKCDKVCEHIHLPVQAGDDKILKSMNRKYTISKYGNLIKKIRGSMPKAAISTDIIVGFPGESDKQFENTAKLARQMEFDQIYVAQYSERPGTAAAQLADDVPKTEKRRRERVLADILRHSALKKNKKYIGETIEVLVEAKNRKGNWLGRTRSGKNVELLMSNAGIKAGDFVTVRITEARDFGLSGELIKG